MTVPSDIRVFCVDDSGVESTGWVVFGWVEYDLANWSAVLAHRLALRRALYAGVEQIPASYNLHTTDFLGNRGDPPSLDEEWNSGSRKFIRKKRAAVLERVLENTSSCPTLGVGLAARHTEARGVAFAEEKASVYTALVQDFDTRLHRSNDLGILVMDGDGSDFSYSKAHRTLNLTSRRLLDDPLYQRSERSQLIQMADLVAFSGYQKLLRDSRKEFAWSWFDTYLAALDVNGGVLML